MDEISAGAVQLKPEYIVGLSVLATVGLVAMWGGVLALSGSLQR